MDIDLNGSYCEEEEEDSKSASLAQPASTVPPSKKPKIESGAGPDGTYDPSMPTDTSIQAIKSQQMNASSTQKSTPHPSTTRISAPSLATASNFLGQSSGGVGFITSDDMTQTMWNIFFRRIASIDLSDAVALGNFMEAAETSYYFYVEIFQPAFSRSLPSVLTPSDFLRSILSQRMPDALRLLESQGVSNSGAHHISMMDQLITARRDKRRIIVGVVCTDQKKVLLLTGNKNDCWDVPSKVLRDGQSPVEAAKEAMQECTGQPTPLLDEARCVQQTLGQVSYYYYFYDKISAKSEIKRMPGRINSVRTKVGFFLLR
jgi:hypothetical protein